MKTTTVQLGSEHYRKEFNCGESSLDSYIQTQATQDIKKKLAACFVYSEIEKDINYVKGYYTLSNTGIDRELVPEQYRKKFPKSYKTIPATLLGRLARDVSMRGKGIGEALLMDALFRSHLVAKEIGSFAVVVDPIDENAQAFYESYGFIRLPDSGKMFLAMKTIDQLF